MRRHPKGCGRACQSSVCLVYCRLQKGTTTVRLAPSILMVRPTMLRSPPKIPAWLKQSRRASAPTAHKRLSSALVVCEIAISLTLLVDAALLLKSFWRLIHVAPGFQTEHVVTARPSLNQPPDGCCPGDSRARHARRGIQPGAPRNETMFDQMSRNELLRSVAISDK
jgi:hypothetical protein